ncbi:MAG: tyrosine-type recombinase/integrase [Methanothrix sp.]
MDSLIEDFRRDCLVRGMAKRSVETYLNSIKICRGFLSGQGEDILTIDRAAIQGYIEYLRLERQVSLKTVKMHLTALSTLYEFLVFEGHINLNPVLPVRRRYSRRYKDGSEAQTKQLISVEDMARLINSTMGIRDKAVITLLAKTGIRRNELITLDISDVDLIENKIKLKATGKRTNRVVFFDDEAALLLRRWLKIRDGMNRRNENALFLSNWGHRISRTDVYEAVIAAAARVGLHNAASERLEDHFGPHCCRHWFCTHLFRAGMRREYIKELRGDSRKEAFDLYNHIDLKELKEAYLACIPQLGV